MDVLAVEILLLVILLLVGVFAVYWFIGHLVWVAQRWSLRQKGRVILWNDACERVQARAGYFILACSGRHRDLFYADGEVPPNFAALWQAYEELAALVEDQPEHITWADLQAKGMADRCIELNCNVFVD